MFHFSRSAGEVRGKEPRREREEMARLEESMLIRLVDKSGGHPEQAPRGRRRGGAQSKDPVECRMDALRLVRCHGMLRLRSVPASARDGTPLSMTPILNAELRCHLC